MAVVSVCLSPHPGRIRQTVRQLSACLTYLIEFYSFRFIRSWTDGLKRFFGKKNAKTPRAVLVQV